MNFTKEEYEKNLASFWDNRPDGDAHRTDDHTGRFLKPVNPLDFENETVLDYGCGGGHLGKQLCEHVKHFIGLDVSQRSLDWAELYLDEYPNKTLKRVDRLADYKGRRTIDTLFCFFCIQHFPSFDYLEDFLLAIKERSPRRVILGIRYAEKPIYTPHNFYHMIQTNAEEINKVLDYEIQDINKITKLVHFITFVRP